MLMLYHLRMLYVHFLFISDFSKHKYIKQELKKGVILEEYLFRLSKQGFNP